MPSRFIVILLGFLSLVVSGCASTNAANQQNNLPELLTNAKKAYLKGISGHGVDTEQLNKAQQLARTYVKRMPDGRYAADAWLILGQVEYQEKQYQNVLKAVENGLKHAGKSDLKVALYMLKGKASETLGNPSNALDAYQSASDLVDGGTRGSGQINVPELEYRRANMLVRNGKFDQAERTFRVIIDEYPDTDYARKSIDRIRFMSDYFSVQLGLFRQKKNALSLKRKLEREGRNPYVLSTNTRDGSIYSVRLGKFNRYEPAQELAGRLKEQGREVVIKP